MRWQKTFASSFSFSFFWEFHFEKNVTGGHNFVGQRGRSHSQFIQCDFYSTHRKTNLDPHSWHCLSLYPHLAGNDAWFSFFVCFFWKEWGKILNCWLWQLLSDYQHRSGSTTVARMAMSEADYIEQVLVPLNHKALKELEGEGESWFKPINVKKFCTTRLSCRVIDSRTCALLVLYFGALANRIQKLTLISWSKKKVFRFKRA